jgi:hypothetical protein
VAAVALAIEVDEAVDEVALVTEVVEAVLVVCYSLHPFFET